MLTTDAQVPEMTETAMEADLLHALKVLAKLDIDNVRHNVEVLAIGTVLLTIQEPVWDIELTRVLDHSNDSLNLVVGELTSALVKIDLSLLQDKVGETATYTTNLGQSKHNLVGTLQKKRKEKKKRRVREEKEHRVRRKDRKRDKNKRREW
jgi:hypothetical protein